MRNTKYFSKILGLILAAMFLFALGVNAGDRLSSGANMVKVAKGVPDQMVGPERVTAPVQIGVRDLVPSEIMPAEMMPESMNPRVVKHMGVEQEQKQIRTSIGPLVSGIGRQGLSKASSRYLPREDV